MKKSKNAFTMIEMIFVIVVLGILASVAIPKFAATRTDAQISKARADIASIRSAIVSERQTRLIKGDSNWIDVLSQDTDTLFDGNGTSKLLMYGITAKDADGHWKSTDGTSYTYKVGGVTNTFKYYPTQTTVGGVVYEAGTFNCTSGSYCSNLTD